ncbi:hypothetical protein [Cystobacter ferrugineus]|uniref:Uncharacterized protein n=1 Tax=Cystobacter ferrugineus TaxID=83449 RepID=A0A1L9AY62_9BACT|nr:hypothetical protein [Cystobacter ferrugineus]OJH34944.1 hypothetical protein BON30_40895 [Cystobacter ferrugineus]
MKQLLLDALIQAMDDPRYPPHVRTLLRTWVEVSFRFNEWYLAEVRHRDDEEPFYSMLGESLKTIKALDLAAERYLAHPEEGNNEESLLAALKESIRVRVMLPGDWTPKGS